MFFVLPGLALIMLSLYPLIWTVINTFIQYQNLCPSNLSFGHLLSAAIGAAFKQSPHAFIVGGISLMVAIQLISLGILALQSKRYFEELFHLSSTASSLKFAAAGRSSNLNRGEAPNFYDPKDKNPN